MIGETGKVKMNLRRTICQMRDVAVDREQKCDDRRTRAQQEIILSVMKNQPFLSLRRYVDSSKFRSKEK
jgi:hypothetical protein